MGSRVSPTVAHRPPSAGLQAGWEARMSRVMHYLEA